MTPVDAGIADHCGVGGEGCLTCGDVAVPLTVRTTTQAGDAECVDAHGRTEVVAADLVGPVEPGARVLVHAGVAIALIGPEAMSTGATT